MECVKYNKRLRICFALALIVIGLMIAPAALGEKLRSLWVAPEDTQANQTIDNKPMTAINWWKRGSRYYIFLPAGMDSSNLRLCFSGTQMLYFEDGSGIASGEITDKLIPGQDIIVTDENNKTYKLRPMQSQNISAMFIFTESKDLDYIHKSKDNKETGSWQLMPALSQNITDSPINKAQEGTLEGQSESGIAHQPEGEFKNELEGEIEEIRVRGNGTADLPKKPYQIKLNKKIDFVGSGAGKTWILLANHKENSLLRNKIALEMAEYAGLAYTPDSIFIDLYINNNYLGNYQLCEKVHIHPERIAINDLGEETAAINDEPLENYKRVGPKKYTVGTRKYYEIPKNPEDITGGYLLELELTYRYIYEPSGIVTDKGQTVVIKEPEYVSKEQSDYIYGLVQGLENALNAKDGIDPETNKHYTEFIDLESFVKKYLLEEVVKNYDGNRTSQYFYKPSDSVSTLLYAGPAWDYDQSMGSYGSHAKEATGLSTAKPNKFFWYPKAYKQSDFQKEVIKLYHKHYAPALNILLGNSIDENHQLFSIQEYADYISASADMNYTRWDVFNAWSIKTGENYKENIDYVINFLTKRKAYLDKTWVSE